MILPGQSGRRRFRIFPLGVVVAAAAALGACGSTADQPASSPRPPRAATDATQALDHIHGLGVDPDTERLFIATHQGLFAADRGVTTPARVGTSTQDIMGFSLLKPGTFIGSGHPAPGQNVPPHLGLIRSRDGGTSWKNVSLLGQADFHVLESSGRRVYGFDGTQGRLMVSRDAGTTFAQRTVPAPTVALAIDPTNPSRVVASTEGGIAASADAGRSWRPRTPDRIGLLAWPRKRRLYLVDGQGTVLVSTDSGANWRRRGAIGGQPAAFIATGDDLYAGLADGTVKRSTDGGVRWTVRTTGS